MNNRPSRTNLRLAGSDIVYPLAPPLVKKIPRRTSYLRLILNGSATVFQRLIYGSTTATKRMRPGLFRLNVAATGHNSL